MRTRRQRLLWIAAFVLFWAAITAGSLIGDAYQHRVPWIGALGRIVVFVTIGGAFVYGAVLMRTQKELERLIFLETSAIAFYAVLAAALVSAALDELHVVSRPTPWVFWNVGWITWCVARAILVRRRT